jgi:hypothetical protein
MLTDLLLGGDEAVTIRVSRFSTVARRGCLACGPVLTRRPGPLAVFSNDGRGNLLALLFVLEAPKQSLPSFCIVISLL